jgi:uncharacterized cupin superfamily protein
MTSVSLPGFYSWSQFGQKKQMDFNGHLWVRQAGNVLIDPVPMSKDDVEQLLAMGGAKLCVITNSDHTRDVAALRERFGFDVVAHELEAASLGVPVARRLRDGEEIVPGMIVVHLAHGKSPGEIALWLPEHECVLFGDLLQGAPVGALTLIADEKLKDPARAALELRKVLRLPLQHVLVGDGHSLFGYGREAILACVEARTDIDIHHVRPQDLDWVPVNTDPRYRHEIKELSRLVGSRKLAYNLRRLPPGAASGPLHFHRAEEELFVVLEGRCQLESPRGTTPLTAGDVVACPPGELGAHTLRNVSEQPCVVLCLSDVVPYDQREQVGITDFRQDLITP